MSPSPRFRVFDAIRELTFQLANLQTSKRNEH